jgi:hypothetical protein
MNLHLHNLDDALLSIKRWANVYLEQYRRAINRVINSAANPLPTREKPRRIPLRDGFSGSIQSIDLSGPLGGCGGAPQAQK